MPETSERPPARHRRLDPGCKEAARDRGPRAGPLEQAPVATPAGPSGNTIGPAGFRRVPVALRAAWHGTSSLLYPRPELRQRGLLTLMNMKCLPANGLGLFAVSRPLLRVNMTRRPRRSGATKPPGRGLRVSGPNFDPAVRSRTISRLLYVQASRYRDGPCDLALHNRCA